VALTFRGGLLMDGHKNTRSVQIENMPSPDKVTIPMSQHIGTPATPVVKVGDTVEKGQVIGNVSSGLGCPVHSSVSGKVTAISTLMLSNGRQCKAVEIENDHLETIFSGLQPFKKRLGDTSAEEIIEIIRNAGIVGMGGATFPTYAKIQSAIGKAQRLIINCAECEPYITANHRLLLEDPASVVNGAKILLKALSLRKCDIAIEDNKMDAVKMLRKMLSESDLFDIHVMKTKYPQGDERQLIYALTRVELPSGKLPADVGCLIFNAETCAAVFKAFHTGMPLVERIVTVDGDCIKTPKNLNVAIGTPFSKVIEYCGGLKQPIGRLICGGPMMGTAQWDIESPIAKGTSALLAFSEKATRPYDQEPVCIHCGRCITGCPMSLVPSALAAYSNIGRYDICEKYDAMSCVECGACSFVCPGSVPITALIRKAKDNLRAQNEAKKAMSVSADKKTPAESEKDGDKK
jgi:electron transport complex protein RnfC